MTASVSSLTVIQPVLHHPLPPVLMSQLQCHCSGRKTMMVLIFFTCITFLPPLLQTDDWMRLSRWWKRSWATDLKYNLFKGKSTLINEIMDHFMDVWLFQFVCACVLFFIGLALFPLLRHPDYNFNIWIYHNPTPMGCYKKDYWVFHKAALPGLDLYKKWKSIFAMTNRIQN